jgi:hypothetical protein
VISNIKNIFKCCTFLINKILFFRFENETANDGIANAEMRAYVENCYELRMDELRNYIFNMKDLKLFS